MVIFIYNTGYTIIVKYISTVYQLDLLRIPYIYIYITS